MRRAIFLVICLIYGTVLCGAPATMPATTRAAKIGEFQNEYRFFSNFWPAEVQFEGITYPTAEHAYQSVAMPVRPAVPSSCGPTDSARIPSSPRAIAQK